MQFGKKTALFMTALRPLTRRKALFRGIPGARGFRRHLATEAVKAGAGANVLLAALSHLDANTDLAQAAA